MPARAYGRTRGAARAQPRSRTQRSDTPGDAEAAGTMPLEEPPIQFKRLLLSGAFRYNPERRYAVHKPLVQRPPNPHVNYFKRVPLSRPLWALATGNNEQGRGERENAEPVVDATTATNTATTSVFLRLPTEIRIEIYKLLLVNKEPVRVNRDWTQVFKGSSPGRGRNRAGPAIVKSMLLVCRQVYAEAVTVLYGCNTFEYVVRDGVAAPGTVGDPVLAPANDGDDLDYDASSGAARAREMARNRARANDSPARKTTFRDGEIFFDKFLHLFRHVSIAIESNRHDAKYRRAMARAIQLFFAAPATTNINNSNNSSSSSNARPTTRRSAAQRPANQRPAQLHTLMIRVYPMRSATALTHADFFSSSGEVVAALRGLPVRHVRIRVGTSQLSRDPSTGVEIRLDMGRIKTTARGEADVWAGNESVLRRRAMLAEATHGRLMGLEEEIRKECVTVEQVEEGGSETGANDDDGFDDGDGIGNGGGVQQGAADDDEDDMDVDSDADSVDIQLSAADDPGAALAMVVMPASEADENFVVLATDIEVDHVGLSDGVRLSSSGRGLGREPERRAEEGAGMEARGVEGIEMMGMEMMEVEEMALVAALGNI